MDSVTEKVFVLLDEGLVKAKTVPYVLDYALIRLNAGHETRGIAREETDGGEYEKGRGEHHERQGD